MERKISSKIPASESGPNTVYTARSGEEYWITRNPKKGKFTLWLKRKDGYEKLESASSPYDLYGSLN